MPKIRIIESITDPLLISSGRGKVVVDKGFETSIIQNSPDQDIKIKVLSSETREDQESIYEVAKVRIDSVKKQGSRSAISRSIQARAEFTNHQVTIAKLLDINEINDQNITKATPSYSVECNFNYVSQDYDNLQISVNELNLMSAIGSTTKDDILNFRKKKSAKVLDFSRGNRLKNFVQPQNGYGGLEREVPYYNRIQINSTTNGGFSDFTQKIQIYDEVLNHYLNSEKDSVQMNIQDETLVLRDTPLQVYNVKRFLDEVTDFDTDNFYGLKESNLASKMGLDLRKHLMKGYLKNVTKNGFRKFEDILMNVDCYKEGFAYSAEKFDSFLLDSAKLQTLLAPSGQTSTRLLDTQVKYGKTYVYRAFAHYLVVGNSYSYRNVRYFEEDGITYATAEVVNKPNYVIVPVELFTEEKTVIQPPPVAPQVTFRTENNSNNEIQIYLSPTKSEVRQSFIQITDADMQQQEEMDKFFKKDDGKYRFKTTTQSGLYEVFRTSEPPESYSSFADSKLGETRMAFRDTNAILVDRVEPNKFYYYICRHLNEKELVSNPTSVFKVMLVKDADDSKVVVDTYRFPKPTLSQPSRDFKNMLQVKLKGTLKDLKLGIVEKSIWGRKIKLRVKSKTSGKILDLNIDFNLAKNKTKEEF
jgi:hypothetical protein